MRVPYDEQVQDIIQLLTFMEVNTGFNIAPTLGGQYHEYGVNITLCLPP